MKIRLIRFDFQTSPILASGSLANSTRSDIGQRPMVLGLVAVRREPNGTHFVSGKALARIIHERRSFWM